MLPTVIILAVVFLALIMGFKMLKIQRIIIFEYQKGLKYRKGRYAGTVDAGQYWISSLSSWILPVEMRPEFITIQGQDLLSADGVTLKISLAAQFQIVDPNL